MKLIELAEFRIEGLRLAERPEPKPGPGQAKVRVRACSLNYRDLLMAKGIYNPKAQLPLVPFSDAAGDVVEVGEGVTRVKPGDRVAAIFMQRWLAGELNHTLAKSALGGGGEGVLAAYIVLHEDGLVHVPLHLTYEEAATLPCAAVTAWHAVVTQGHVKAGDSVLLQGTGGVSLFALQFCTLLGARVIITSSSDEKLRRALELGAHDEINYRTTPEWDAAVRDLTRGVGVDHIVEVGGAGTLARSFQAVRTGGQISLIGVLTGGGGEVNPLPVLMKAIRVQGIYVGSREMFEAMNRAIELHKLRPVIDSMFPLEKTADALRHLESGSHFGKIVIRVAGGK